MSWQVYVTDQLMTPGEMCSAGIYGLDGGEWSGDGNLRPSPQEITRLVSIIQGKESDYNGIRLAGIPFLYVSHDPQEGSIILNRIHAPSDKEKYVCCGYLAKSCFIFGAVVGNYRMGNCSKVSCRLRDYLKQNQRTMSWDAHVKSLMAGPGMKYAGLFGLDGNPWAKSAAFNPTQVEVARLIKLVQGKDIGGENITVGGIKYMFRSPAEDGLLTVLSLGGGEEKYVCNVCETTKGVVIGVALASSAGASREYLDKYKNYLKGIGY